MWLRYDGKSGRVASLLIPLDGAQVTQLRAAASKLVMQMFNSRTIPIQSHVAFIFRVSLPA